MRPSATCNDHPLNTQRQKGFTLVEILISLGIIGFVLGTAVLQISSLYKTNRTNASVVNVNTLAANELENIKQNWSENINWEAGTYTPTASNIAFSCANWMNLDVPPTVFGSSCVGASYLKRVKLVIRGSDNKAITVFLDIAKPT